jgi:hypothetical protein
MLINSTTINKQKIVIMKKVLVMGIALMLSGATATMAQTKKPMKKKVDSTMTMSKDTSMMKHHNMKKKTTKPVKDSASTMK